MVGIAEDEQLEILAAVRGDLGAFNSLVLRYQDSVYTTAYRPVSYTHLTLPTNREV